MEFRLSEQMLMDAIYKVLSEGRTVIKTGNSNQQMPPMDTAPMPTAQDMPPMDNTQQEMPPMDDMQQEMPPMDNNGGDSEFDTNFDAGVEADEDTDPKKYIQQLTGKLSQTLSSYCNEQGGDAELCKYVGKMILKQAAKGLDEAGKKELIKAINTTENGDNAESEVDDEEVPTDDMGGDEPMMEAVLTKKDIVALMESITNDCKRIRKKNNSPFGGYNITR